MEKEEYVNTPMGSIKKTKGKKISRDVDNRDRVYMGLFVLIIVVAVILSLIISLLVFSISSSKSLSTDSGTVIVEVSPNIESQEGKITVEIVESEKEVNSNAN